MPVTVRKTKRRQKAKKTVRKTEQELTRLGSALRSLGGLAGGAVGSLVGMPATGSSYGTSLGAALSRWLGSGDYSVSSNSILKSTASIPAMHREGQSIVVRHKEFIGEIVGSQSFKVQRILELNPGIKQTLPWASRLAECYQEYTIRGMVFHYIPTSGNAISGVSAALGSVMLQTTYRATDSAPTTKTEMLNEYWASESVPSESFVHPIECDPKENPFKIQYVRTVDLPATENQLLYDLGKTFVATQGMQSDAITVGDLWVTYEIEFRKPVVRSTVAPNVGSIVGTITSSSATNSNIFAGTQSSSLGDFLFGANNVITIADPAEYGYYYFYLAFNPTTNFTAFAGPSAPPAITGGVVVFVTASGDQQQRNILGGTTPTLNRGFYTFAVFKNQNTSPCTLTLGSFANTGTLSSIDVTIWRADNPIA